jgi:glycosyltransferase involved in cell wall biosynthesis
MVTDSRFLCEETMYLGELKKEMKTRGVTVNLLSLMDAPWSTLEGKLPVERLLKTAFLIPTIRDCDIVHVQFTFPIGFLLSLLRHLHGKPVIIHTHGDDVFVVPSAGIGFRRYILGRLLTKISWKTASRIIAVCKEAGEEIWKTGVPRSRINVLYNGVNENFFFRGKSLQDNKYAAVRENSDFIFLNVGGLKEVKNQVRLLTAFSLHAEDSNLKSRLVICGSGHLNNTLHNLAHKLRIADRVVFMGRVPHGEMPELYSAADAYILPSIHEAHPWSILEAMSCELPVAASNVGGIPETLSNEKLLINPWDVDDIHRAMQFLAENPKGSKAIGIQNRRIVLEKFTLRRHATQLESIYQAM